MAGKRESRSKPEQVADALRLQIEKQRYRLGDKLPSQRDLVDEFEVSRETIRRALARLESEGFIKTRGQGARSEVAQSGEASAADDDADEISVVRARQIITDSRHDTPDAYSLESVIKRAFREKEVTLDALSLTTESLGHHLGSQLDAVERGDLRPDSVTLRFVLPSKDHKLLYPAAIDPNDDSPHERWARIVEVHLDALKQRIMMLSENSEVLTEVCLKIKRVPKMTPQFKFYILNNEILLCGLYLPKPRNMILDDDSVVPALDVLGLQSDLFYHSATDYETQGSRYFAEYRAAFEAYWNNVPGELTQYPSD